MAGILEKLRVVTLSNVHKLLDQVISWDDIGALKVYARDLEGAVQQMVEFDNTLLGAIATLKNQLKEDKKYAEQLQEDIDSLLKDDDKNNDHHALALQVQLNKVNASVDGNGEKLTQKEKDHNDAEKAISMLKAKHQEVVNKIKELAGAEEEAEAAERGTKAVEAMKTVFDEGVSVDNIGAKILQRRAKARAGFERAMGEASDAVANDVTIGEAEAALSRRREQLGLTK